jgi:hypothetical protein
VRAVIGDHLLIQRHQSRGESGCVLADPPVGDLLDRHRIEVVPLGASVPHGDHQIGLGEYGKVLHHSEAGHLGKLSAQFIERLPVAAEQAVQKCPPGRVGERSKDLAAQVHALTIGDLLVTCQSHRGSRRNCWT